MVLGITVLSFLFLVSFAGATQNSISWNNQGIDLANSGKYNEAIKAFDKAIEIKPHDSKFWNNKGYALSKQNKYYEALKAYEKAIEINPQYSKAWYNRACIYSLINNKNLSILNLKKAIELGSSNKEKARKDDDFKGLWADEQFKALLGKSDKANTSLLPKHTEYREVDTTVKAEDILKHIQTGDDINLVEETVKEDGCIEYGLYQELNNPRILTM